MDYTDIPRYSVGYMPRNGQTDRSRRSRPLPVAVRRTLREVADHVATWRKLRGLTQAQVAERADVSRDTVVRLEHGEGGVSVENLLRVLRALGILDGLSPALDPYETDLGRLRSSQRLPQRVRPRSLLGPDDA